MKIALMCLSILVLSSCSSKPKGIPQASAAKSSSQKNYSANVSLVSGVTPSTGTDASNFSWYDDSGKLVSLSDFKGKTVLVNFWATWCGPCKAELPDIEAVSREYASKGLVIVGVSEDRGDGLVQSVADFAAKHGLTYQIVIDNDNIANAYGNINAIPTSFLIDSNGKIVDKWIGVRNKAFFESTVNKYLD